MLKEHRNRTGNDSQDLAGGGDGQGDCYSHLDVLVADHDENRGDDRG